MNEQIPKGGTERNSKILALVESLNNLHRNIKSDRIKGGIMQILKQAQIDNLEVVNVDNTFYEKDYTQDEVDNIAMIKRVLKESGL